MVNTGHQSFSKAINMSRQSVLSKCLIKCLIKMSYKIVLSKCFIKMSHSVLHVLSTIIHQCILSVLSVLSSIIYHPLSVLSVLSSIIHHPSFINVYCLYTFCKTKKFVKNRFFFKQSNMVKNGPKIVEHGQKKVKHGQKQ